MPVKQLTTTQRKEINQMLKNIDKTNIGAIKSVDKAIERLRTKKEKIKESKQNILNKQNAEEKNKNPIDQYWEVLKLYNFLIYQNKTMTIQIIVLRKIFNQILLNLIAGRVPLDLACLHTIEQFFINF